MDKTKEKCAVPRPITSMNPNDSNEMNHKSRAPMTRRGFLGAVTVACAAPAFARAATTTPTRIGLIGCGARGVQHLRVLKDLPGTLLTLACDTDPARRTAALAVADMPVTGSWEDLVASPDIDAIIIATPDPLHADALRSALDHGKHVYCEDPVSLGMEEARAVCRLAEASGLTVQFGAVETSDHAWRLCRELIQSGRIGKVRWCQAAFRHSLRGTVPAASSQQALLSSVHYQCLAPMILAAGLTAPRQLSLAGGSPTSKGGPPETFTTTIEYAGGPSVVLSAYAANLSGLQLPIIRGDKAAIEIGVSGVRIFDEANNSSVEHVACGEEITGCPVHHALRRHLNDWLSAIQTRRPCACPPDLALKTQTAVSLASEAYLHGSLKVA